MRRWALVVLLAACGSAAAQFSVRGEVELATDATVTRAAPARVGWTVAAHVDAEYELAPVTFNLVADPSVRFGEEVRAEPGLTEAYAFTRTGPADVSAGRERLPLEVARLNAPYRVEARGERGARRGVTGARVHYYAGEVRLRAATFLHPGSHRVTPLVSVRSGFGAFELEAHALYTDQFVVGLGGSGLVGDLVAYAEAWLPAASLRVRGAAGVNGNLPSGSWTLEAAHLPPARPDGLPADDTARARPVVDGQLSLSLDDYGDHGLTLSAGLDFDDDATRGDLGGAYTFTQGNRDLTLSAHGAFGPEPAVASASVSVRGYF